MRTPIVAGNWKLHKTPDEAAALAREIRRKVASIQGVQIAVAPTFVSLVPVAKVLEDSAARVGQRRPSRDRDDQPLAPRHAQPDPARARMAADGVGGQSVDRLDGGRRGWRHAMP